MFEHVSDVSFQSFPAAGISEYQAIEDDTVSLPCNISAGEWNEAQISLLVWYRSGSKGTPIYSIDARNSLANSRHQIPPELGGRVRMDFTTRPPVLYIDSVKASDAGDYRCRVDYRMNRTQQFLIHLNVSGKLFSHFCFSPNNLLQFAKLFVGVSYVVETLSNLLDVLSLSVCVCPTRPIASIFQQALSLIRLFIITTHSLPCSNVLHSLLFCC